MKELSLCVTMKKGLLKIFTLSDPDVSLILIATSTLPSTSLHKLTAYLSLVVYDSEEVEIECGEECILAGHCQCSKCK